MKYFSVVVLTAFVALFMAPPRASVADTFTAKVYDLKTGQLLYNLTSKDTPEAGGRVSTQATFFLPNGKVAAAEASETEGANHLIKYVEDQQLSPEQGSVEVRGGRVYFSYQAGGKTKTDDEKLGDTLLVNPLTVPFLRANWGALMKGDTVEARFAAVSRCETVGFKFFKSGEEKRGGRDVVTVTMKPSSFIIAAIRSPMTFVFDKATEAVIEFDGQVLPKPNGNDQDARIVYGN